MTPMDEALTAFDRAIFALAPATRDADSDRGTRVTVTVQHKPMPTHWGPLSNPSILVRFASADGSLVARMVAQQQADDAVRRWLALDAALPGEAARVRVIAADGTDGPGYSDSDTETLLRLLRDWPTW